MYVSFFSAGVVAVSLISDEAGVVIFFGSIAAFILLAMFGFFVMKRKNSDLRAEVRFADNFMERVNYFIKSEGKDKESYKWLLQRSARMQDMMGRHGKMDYKMPGEGYSVKDDDIVLSFIPQLNKEFKHTQKSTTAGQKRISFYVKALRKHLARSAGDKKQELDLAKDKIKRPYHWIEMGLRQLLALPAYAVAATGAMTFTAARRLRESLPLKMLSLLLILIIIAANVVIIFIGWNNFWTSILG